MECKPDDVRAALRHQASARSAPPALRIREDLEQAILLGELPSGSRLDEQALAHRFEVSRTPVREALQQLIATGLVEHRPHRGRFVRGYDAVELHALFEFMAELEAAAGRLAARRIDTAGLASMERAVEACERAADTDDPDHYYRENGRLHAQLYDASGNRFLADEAAALHARLQAYRRLQLRVPSRLRESMAEHRGVLEALRAGDGDAAAARLRAHVSVQGTRFGDLLSRLPA